MRIIPFDIVDIGEITNTRIAGQQEEGAGAKPVPAAQQKPQPPEKVAPLQKPPEPAPKTPEKAETVPDALSPKPMSKPTPPAPPKPEPPKPQPQPDQLTSVLKNVAKLKPTTPDEAKADKDATSKEKATPEARGAAGASSGSTGAGAGSSTETGVGKGVGFGPALGDRLMISEEDALRRQISQCWNMPVGAKEAENLAVEVLIEVNPDRTVREVHIVDEMRLATDRYFRAAAESAVRALRSPKCTPLALNPDKYEQWKVIRFNFDPRDML
jgi:hypothetical protein